MLGLKLPTDPRWVNMAAMSLEDVLTDHAYCEQKAATACITLIQAFPDCERLVEELAPVVTEEWGHFRMVIAELKKRDLKLGYQRKDEYVNELIKFGFISGTRKKGWYLVHNQTRTNTSTRSSSLHKIPSIPVASHEHESSAART